MFAQFRRYLSLASLCLGLPLLTGCQWYEQFKGPGFSNWNQSVGSGMRGKNPDAKPSGLLYDKRSGDIEKNLGGDFN